MIKHLIKPSIILPEAIPTIISWSLVIEDNVLRLKGDDGSVEFYVISIFSSGKAYRHQNVALVGLDVDAKGKVKEYSTRREAYMAGKGGQDNDSM